MESKYLTEITEYCMGYRGGENSKAQTAARRIQNRIKAGVTLVIVRVANPRYK